MKNENIKLFCNDCFNVLPELPNKSVNLILTDLPYNLTNAKFEKAVDFSKLWNEYKRILADKGNVILTAIPPFTATVINSNPKWYRYSWYWIKNIPTGFPFCKYQPLRKVEEILVFHGLAGGGIIHKE